MPTDIGRIESAPPGRVDVLLDWLAGQPLVPAAIGLVLGIALDAVWAMPLALILAVFAAAGVSIVVAKRNDGLRHLGLLLAAMALGAMLHDLEFRRYPGNHIVHYCDRAPRHVRLTGVVVAPPTIRASHTGRIQWFTPSLRSRMLVEAETLEGVTGPVGTAGTLAVFVREPILHVSAGDRVEMVGTIYRPPPPANPGGKDWTLANRRQGILVQMSCERAANVTVQAMGQDEGRWLKRLRQRLRAAMLDNTFEGDEPGAQLVSAMILGQRSAMDADLSQPFVDTGTAHFLSVSGAHVGMLASVVWLTGFLVGASRRSCAGFAIILITAYAVIAEPRPPIIRAAIMADMLCVSMLWRRPMKSGNWIALAAIVLLIASPTQLFAPGFQLSFLCVLAVMYLSPRLHETCGCLIRRGLGRDDPLLAPDIRQQLNPPSRCRMGVNWFLHILGWWFAISVSAWPVGSALSAYHFGQFSLLGWLNCVLVMPLVWLTLVVGFFKTLLSIVLSPAVDPLGWPFGALTDTLIAFVRFLARLPGAGMSVPALPGWLIGVGLIMLGLWTISRWLRIKGRWLAVSAGVFGCLLGWQVKPVGKSDVLRLHVLSVGNGNACVIGLPNGRTLLYDAGSLPPYDIERWTIGPLLAQERVGRIDAIVISHANLDHFSALPDVIEHRSVGEVIVSPHFEQFAASSWSAPRRLMTDIDAQGVPTREVVAGYCFADTGDATIDVLWPPPPETLAIGDANNTSIVLRITCAGRCVLLCGDIEELAEQQLMQTQDLAADVLLLPHHGGVSDTTRAFIEAVAPTWCIRSSGHHDAETTNGLIELLADRKYFNTADDGAVEVQISPSALTVEPYLRRNQ